MSERERSVMFDIETKGTGVNSFILSIGAVAFDDDGFLSGYDKTNPVAWYGQVPWNDPSQSERDVDPETMTWWDSQREPLQILQTPDSAQAEWVYPGIEDLLEAFSAFVKAHKTSGGRMICKGSDFDIAIVRSAMRYFRVEPSWKYNHTRCMRGWLDACYAVGISPHLHLGFQGGNPGIKHHAADDAIWQTMLYVRYNHKLWQVAHKSAQQSLPLDTTNGPGLMAAPDLKDAP